MTIDGDYSVRDLICLLRWKREHYPVSDEMEARHPYSVDKWYRSQKEHVLGFLREYDGPGAYDRKGFGHTARFWWNHFQCPPGLIWAAEALGVDGETVRRAYEASIDAEGAGKRLASQCAAIRKVIPWETLYLASRG